LAGCCCGPGGQAISGVAAARRIAARRSAANASSVTLSADVGCRWLLQAGDELAGSRSDSMLNRLPVRLDAVQELSDSGSEDVSAAAAAAAAAVDPFANASAPTSPSFYLIMPEHRTPLSSPPPPPDSSGKPPVGGASVSRKSSELSSPAGADAGAVPPKSPAEYAALQGGHKVEMRPPKTTSAATKRVSSFRKSLIK